MVLINEYQSASFKNKILKKPKELKFIFADIDNTLTGNVEVVNQIRNKLENLGFIFGLVTARTEEMLMSSKQYSLSQKNGFKRPRPKLNFLKNRFKYIPVEEFEPFGILDPDIIIGSSGTAILIKQKEGGYLEDKIYKKMLGPKNWRTKTLSLLKKIDPKEEKYFLLETENPNGYKKGLSNIYTPPFRIQINFKNLKDKEFIYKKLQSSQKDFSLNLNDDSDPRNNKYSLYITPKGFTKGKAVNHVVERLCQTFNLKREFMRLIFAGDALADLDMGYLQKDHADSTLLIVGGSRLTRDQIKSFTSKISGIPPKKIIIGDEQFPGTIGPQTLLAFFENSGHN